MKNKILNSIVVVTLLALVIGCKPKTEDVAIDKEQIKNEPYDLPELNIKLHFNNKLSFVPEQWLIEDFELLDYKCHKTIKAKLNN